MEGIIALILSGSIFRTPGTWAFTRALSLVDVIVAIFYGYTPLRPRLGVVWDTMLIVTLVVWVVNLARLPRTERSR